MDRIETEKTYPQRVEVVNPVEINVSGTGANPLVVTLPSGLLANNGTAVAVVDQGSHQNEIYVKPSSQLKSLYINAVHVINSGIGYFVPYNLSVLNVTDAKVTSVLAGILGQLSSQFVGSDIKVFYCTQDGSRNYTFDCMTNNS